MSNSDKYEDLLNRVVQNVQQKIEFLVTEGKKVSGKDFEDIVRDAILAEGVDEGIIQHSDHRFPDFIIRDKSLEIGIEVKKTEEEKNWKVQGGSVYESLRNQIKDTYLLVGRFKGKPEARLRKYSDCLSDLSVTHSPRFNLDLDLPKGEDFFTKNDAFDLIGMQKGEKLDKRIRSLLRTDKTTWYSGDIIVPYSKLSAKERLNFTVDGLVLFPDVTCGDYSGFAPWMIYKCLVWCGNIRDVFSAGGLVKRDTYYASRVMENIIQNIDLIVLRIDEMTPLEIKNNWKCVEENLSLEERLEIWTTRIVSKISVSNAQKEKNKEFFPDLFKDKDKLKQSYRDIIVDKFEKELRSHLKDFLNRRDKSDCFS